MATSRRLLETHCLCLVRPNRSAAKIHAARKRGYGCRLWVRKVPSFCIRMQCCHRDRPSTPNHYPGKPIEEMPPRLQWFFLRLLRCHYKRQFVPGKCLVLTEMLSRASIENPDGNNTYNDVEVHAVSVLSSLVSETTLKHLAEETNKDDYLRQVVNCLKSNRPVFGTLKPLESELVVV